MVASIWRYSHFTLAISSFLFVFLAAITGIILAFEPIQEQSHPYHYDLQEITLDQSVSALQNNHKEILSIKKDHNDFIIASVIGEEGVESAFYINPYTGEKVGELIERSSFFQFVTNFHRSLFLKSTGRALVGIASLLLLLIAITGSILILKRQGGIRQIFSKVVKESTAQYYHVLLSRITLIPIVILTTTGVYLSLEKFDLLPAVPSNTILHESDHSLKKPIPEFSIFTTTSLDNFKSLEFPFSEFEDDYFYLKTPQKELAIHQYSGNIVSEEMVSWVDAMATLSATLHTGQGSIIWSVILLGSTVAILYFIYSGFLISIQRRRKSISKPKNKIAAEDAEIILLVGSETGSTYKPAKALFDALLNQDKKVFIGDLNQLQAFNNLQTLLILTSTYGKGEAPKNADRCLKIIQDIQFKKPIEYAVLGFGSLAYPDYCSFAIEVDQELAKKDKATRMLEIEKIHNQSVLDFKNWISKLANTLEIPLNIDEKLWKVDATLLERFRVIHKTECNVDDTFIITLQPVKKSNFQSGDLFAFYPKNEVTPRYYSIAKLDGNLLLSIKKHSLGKASTFLSKLSIGDGILGEIRENPEFHAPKNKPLLLISNGTGIAPFLGMLEVRKQETHLLWGGRTLGSFDLYKPQIDQAIAEKRLQSVDIALSREGDKNYVQDLLFQKEALVNRILQNKGRILICGSLAMESEVRNVIQEITLKNKLNTEVLEKQVLSDCY